MASNPTPLQRAVALYEQRTAASFRPKRAFYIRISIGQKRFGQLLRGQVPPTSIEIKTLSEFFGVPQTDFLQQ